MAWIRVRTIFIGLLGLGFIGIGVFILAVRHRPSRLEIGEQVIPLVVVDGKSGFVVIGVGDGIGSSVQVFESLDGVRIEFSHWSLRRHGQSAELRSNVLRDSLTISDRGYRYSGDGGAKGERIAGVFRDTRQPTKSYAGVYWIAAGGAECIAGDSLDHVLSFEKLYAGWARYTDAGNTR